MMRKGIRSVALVVCLLASSPVMASGIPVFDAASAANFVTQLQRLKEQLDTAKSQLDAAKDQIDSTTGYRGFADIFNNPEIRKLLPPDMVNIYDIAGQTGYGDLDELIEGVEEEYNLPADNRQAEQDIQQRSRTLGATNRALAERAYQGTEERMTQIARLREAIQDTDDPKSIAELQARIATEEAEVTSENTRVQLMRLNALAEQQLVEAQREELKRRYLSSDNTAMPGID